MPSIAPAVTIRSARSFALDCLLSEGLDRNRAEDFLRRALESLDRPFEIKEGDDLVMDGERVTGIRGHAAGGLDRERAPPRLRSRQDPRDPSRGGSDVADAGGRRGVRPHRDGALLARVPPAPGRLRS